MIVIETEGGNKYWTEKYGKNEDGLLKFSTKSKDGKEFTHQINPKFVVSITDVGEVNKKESNLNEEI